MKMEHKRNLFVMSFMIIAVILMGIQIIIGIVWMFRNATAIPSFGDSTEYYNLSYSLILDEYRPILYPLLLRCVQQLELLIWQIPVQFCTYIIQCAASFLSVFYGIAVIDKAVFRRNTVSAKRRVIQGFLSLYLITIPMITFMNFSILTDSLANSMLVLFLSSVIVMFLEPDVPVKNYVLMAVSLAAGCLLRADRLYSCMLFAVIAFLIKIIKSTPKRGQAVIAMLCVCVSVVAVVKGIGKVTQTPGIYGRVKTNLEFVLLDRVVWPNMEANYDLFPEEIREVISRDEAEIFDSHNNNVMYRLAPMVQEACGEEKAREMYYTMAKIVFANQREKVLKDIGEDIMTMAFTPVSSYLNATGRCDKADSWNIYCMSTVTPEWTKLYNTYYQRTFFVLFAIGLILTLYAAIKKNMGSRIRFFRVLIPYLGMVIILTLWFSLGDGAPPNDRYALIIYLFWSLVTGGCLEFWTEPEMASIQNTPGLYKAS